MRVPGYLAICLLLVGCPGAATEHTPDCQLKYDGCNDPCTPICVDMSVYDTGPFMCDLGCAGDILEPPGPCVLQDGACVWGTEEAQ